MLTRAQNKYIRSLTQQKFRNEYKVFIAEGEKIALEWLNSKCQIEMIIATNEWTEMNQGAISIHGEAEVHVVKEHELEALSALKTPNKVMLIARIPDTDDIPIRNEWYIALDELQDPGNMGTIIRIADWFGIKSIVCSPGCVDIYNPKVVQSAMGSHLRVNVYVSELEPFLSSVSLPVFAATLNGENVYKVKKPDAAVLVIGNESRGVSEQVLARATQCVTIPRQGGAESLNAGVSTGILCALLLPV